MIALLSRIFIKNNSTYTDPVVRRAYGQLTGIVGIVLNVLLFAGKYMAGLLSGSVSVMADAFNNLSDAGSSFITLLGFHFAGKSRIRSILSVMEGLNMYQVLECLC